ncbi:Aldo/keto reductase [Rhizoclosmatium globosum]|uniref:Aldo/keto reductase n=1 Tax=Rhizoclosmatium globosum TaxID=329046 RepID=A0A1Y2CZW7_9FUNG|nr:Aldo/keto reductase [Rhizoclosmatium globosum]|eukprot:ORY52571.1 Aldo/keto reductase [Rhizoclosmatium globosum]
MPRLAFGTGTKWYKTNGNESRDIREDFVECVVSALEAGFTHIDTAEMYGTEREVGVALDRFLSKSGKKRSDVFITAKIADPANLSLRCKQSLERLGPAMAGYIDLYLLHSPFWDYFSPDSSQPMKTVWTELESLVHSGLVRSIGVSNFRIQDLQALADTNPSIPPACNQIEHHAYLQQLDLIQFGKTVFPGMQVSAFGQLRPLQYFAEKGDVKAVVDEIASRKSVTASQVLIAWGLQLGFVQVTTTDKKERLVEAVAAQSIELTEQEMDAIRNAGLGHLHRYHMCLPGVHELVKFEMTVDEFYAAWK